MNLFLNNIITNFFILENWFCYFFLGIILSNFSMLFPNNFNIKYYLKIIINILLILYISIIILQVFNIYNFNIFPMVYLEEKDINVVVEGTKININAVPEAAKQLGNVAAFNAGLTAGTALVKKTALPVGLKFGIVFASGAGSVLTYNGSLLASKLMWGKGVEASKMTSISHVVATQDDKGAFSATVTSIGETFVKCPLEYEDTLSTLKELLSIAIGLEICIVLLLIYSIIMLIFINISKKELSLNWASQIPFGKKLKQFILFFQRT